MKTANIIKYLEKNLDSVTKLSNSLYKGEHRINEKPAAVYLIDFATELNEEYLSKINDEVLAKEYYRLSGDLQWNLYYILIRDSIDENIKTSIENDKSFARKQLLSENSFLSYFDKIVFDGKVERGIYDVWRDKLETVGMSFVGDSTVAYTDGMRRIALGQFDSKSSSAPKGKGGNVLEVKQVTSLIDWDKKRLPASLPNFGKINLISGPNAIGKTSLLEFIEMGICGGSYRNPQDKSSTNLKINFNDGTTDSYKPSDKEKYKSRDVAWYNSASTSRNNTLTVNFGRYNFYDADASYRMSHESDKEDGKNSQKQLMSILSQLALGKEMNELELRVEGYLERISKDLRSEKKNLVDTTAYITKHKENLKKLTMTVFDEQKSVKDVIEKLQEFGWKYSIDDYTEGLLEVSNDLIFVQNALDSFLKHGDPLDISDVETLNSKQQSIATLAKSLLTIESEVKTKLATKKKLEKEISSSKLLIEECKPFLKILSVDDAFSIDKLISSSNDLSTKIEQLEHAHSMYVLGVDEVDEKYLKAGFSNLSTQTELRVTQLTKELKAVIKKIESLQEKEGTLQTLKEHIKRLGAEYVDLNPTHHECPMCSSQLPEGQLRKNILKDISKLSASKDILEANKSRKELEKELKELTQTRSALEGLYETYLEVCPGKKITSEKVGEIKELIAKQFESIDKLKLDLKNTTERLTKLKKIGATEESFSAFGDTIAEHLDLKLRPSNKEKILAWINDLEKNLTSLEKESKQITEAIDSKSEAAKALFKAAQIKGSISDKSGLSHAQQVIKDLLEESEELWKFISNERVTSFKVLRTKIASQKERCDEFTKSKREFEKNTSQKSNLESEIKKYEANEESLRKKVSNLTKADSALTELQEKHGKAEALDDFFDKNIKSISETYLRIHSPREFSDLKYDHETQTLCLTRSDTNENVSASQISSGQRAALALSVFLTLNQNLSEGPKVILFDDPVIFADDLNVLSFFDYLRNLSSQGDRQIFFATANDKIASLFRRKFRIFEKDFVDINLELSIDGKIQSA